MQILHPYSREWPQKFEKEVSLLKTVILDFIDIEHIGSTSIPGMTAKPIIDIGVLIESSSEAEKNIKPLKSIGYTYFPESSSPERYFFRKGDPVIFHLSIAYKDQGNYWERQLLFRDYLRANPKAIEEYVKLKEELLQIDPTAGKTYLSGKTSFVEAILAKARKA